MISKFGKVTIKDDEILVENFTFDCNNDKKIFSDCGADAVEWAISRLKYPDETEREQ